MKATTRMFFLVGALALGAVAVAKEEANKIRLGDKAPDFTLVDTKGIERSLSSYEGRIVVLEWINPQCPYVENCYKTKAMQKAYERAKELDKGVVWLAINSTASTDAQRNQGWIDRFKLKYPILLDTDGNVARLYDARRTPHMYVIDKEGVLRYHGAIDNNPFANKPKSEIVNYASGTVQQVVEGETVSPDYVKPYGCTIKLRRR